MALIGRPREPTRSHPLGFAMKPFLDYDYEQNKLFEEQYSKFEERCACLARNALKMERDGFPQEPVTQTFLGL